MDFSFFILFIFFWFNLFCGVFGCNSFEDIEVQVLPRKGKNFTVTIQGCVQRQSFAKDVKPLEVTAKNQIVRHLKHGAVQNMVALTHIEFDNCGTETVAPNSFRNVPKLEKIVIQNSLLKVIPKGVFNNLPALEIIILHNNQINKIDNEAFAKIQYLTSVVASNNRLENWNRNWFTNSEDCLEDVDFRHNLIKKIPANAFENLSQLRKILLDYNEISEIETGAFDGITELYILGLTFNRLIVMAPDLFPKQIRIERFLIEGNKLNYLPSEILRKLSVTEIILDGNPWTCPCYNKILFWLIFIKGDSIGSNICKHKDLPICVESKHEPTKCVEVVDSDATHRYLKQVKVAIESIDEQDLKKCFRFD